MAYHFKRYKRNLSVISISSSDDDVSLDFPPIVESVEQPEPYYPNIIDLTSDRDLSEEAPDMEPIERAKSAISMFFPKLETTADVKTFRQKQEKDCREKWLAYGDPVKGWLGDSNMFVEFLVGPQDEAFYIHRKYIEGRSNFMSSHCGYYQHKENGTFKIVMPCLKTLDPEAFRFVVEYLEVGEFGHRHIHASDKADAFMQCAMAWDAGDQLGMSDILEHISEKIEKTRPWDPRHILALAIVVYKQEGRLLEVHSNMKTKLILAFVQGRKAVLVRLEQHLESFARFPELERDVYQGLADQVTAEMALAEENGSVLENDAISERTSEGLFM